MSDIGDGVSELDMFTQSLLKQSPDAARTCAWLTLLAEAYPVLHRLEQGLCVLDSEWEEEWPRIRTLLLQTELDEVERRSEDVETLLPLSELQGGPVVADHPSAVPVEQILEELAHANERYMEARFRNLSGGPAPENHLRERARQLRKLEVSYYVAHYNQDAAISQGAREGLKAILAEIFLKRRPDDLGSEAPDDSDPMHPPGGLRPGGRRALPVELPVILEEVKRFLSRLRSDDKIREVPEPERCEAILTKFGQIICLGGHPTATVEACLGIFRHHLATPSGTAKKVIGEIYGVSSKTVERRLNH